MTDTKFNKSQIEDLSTSDLDAINGGAVFAKYDGVDGESKAQSYNDVAFDQCDPLFRRAQTTGGHRPDRDPVEIGGKLGKRG